MNGLNPQRLVHTPKAKADSIPAAIAKGEDFLFNTNWHVHTRSTTITITTHHMSKFATFQGKRQSRKCAGVLRVGVAHQHREKLHSSRSTETTVRKMDRDNVLRQRRTRSAKGLSNCHEAIRLVKDEQAYAVPRCV